MRIKASVNSFPAKTYDLLDEIARKVMPSGAYENLIESNRATLKKMSGLSMFDV